MQRKYIDLIWLRGIGALKADTKQSYLGMIWWVLEPLLLASMFYLAFSTGVRSGANNDNHFVFFLLCGLFPFKWTASAITGSANSLISNQGLIGQVYLPKWIFPSVTNLTSFIRFSIILPVLIAILLVGGYQPTSFWFELIIVIFVQIIFNIGLSYLLASAVPLIPDLTHIVPIFIMGLMFTSGIFFDINDRPENIQAILRINPFVSILEAYRDILIHGKSLTLAHLQYPFLASLACLLIGALTLNRFDKYYPRALP